MEQYRDQRPEKQTIKKDKDDREVPNTNLYVFPKVVFTCRSEYLSTDPNYKRSFLPIESINEKKDEESEALHYFHEIRLLPFGSARLEYTVQHVALAHIKAAASHWSQIVDAPKRRAMNRAELMQCFFEEWSS